MKLSDLHFMLCHKNPWASSLDWCCYNCGQSNLCAAVPAGMFNNIHQLELGDAFSSERVCAAACITVWLGRQRATLSKVYVKKLFWWDPSNCRPEKAAAEVPGSNKCVQEKTICWTCGFRTWQQFRPRAVADQKTVKDWGHVQTFEACVNLRLCVKNDKLFLVETIPLLKDMDYLPHIFH